MQSEGILAIRSYSTYNCRCMHRINDAVVHEGKLVLTDLPFADGQHVRVVVEAEAIPARTTIAEVRRLLKGGVERFDEPFEPLIPTDHWEMLK